MKRILAQYTTAFALLLLSLTGWMGQSCQRQDQQETRQGLLRADSAFLALRYDEAAAFYELAGKDTIRPFDLTRRGILLNEAARYREAVDTLFLALDWFERTGEEMVPECMMRIHEQLSVAYGALGDKLTSDIHRNHYLDILDATRQDRELESRYKALQHDYNIYNNIIIAVIAGALLLILLGWTLSGWVQRRSRHVQRQLEGLIDTSSLHIATHKRENVVKKACLAVVYGMQPYIDRILLEVKKLGADASQTDVSALKTLPADSSCIARRLTYVAELVATINEMNEVLTRWIKMKRGSVSLHIESFDLGELFSLMAKSSRAFEQRHQTIVVKPTEAVVKADKALTLFMLNTLADNARKYTPEGGCVEIGATQTPDYVEVSVTDNGPGLSPEEVERIMREKLYQGRGFGLMNCRGIIEKYRKTSEAFSVCSFGVESRIGEGSRFFFRLPVGVRRVLTCLMLVLCSVQTVMGQENLLASADSVYNSDNESGNTPASASDSLYLSESDSLLLLASDYADEAYYANVDGLYEQALVYIDSSMVVLNDHARRFLDERRRFLHLGANTLKGACTESLQDGLPPAELRWWERGYNTDYHVIMDLRNEAAVACLALQRMRGYRYNNQAFTTLYKLYSEDPFLEELCKEMEVQTQHRRMAAWVAIGLLCLFPLVLYGGYWQRQRRRNWESEQEAEDRLRRAEFEDSKLHVQNQVLDNCLSTIKHETAYYPNKIGKMVERMRAEATQTLCSEDVQSMSELIEYYKGVFTLLSSCASRQLEEVTFRRTRIEVASLLGYAEEYATKVANKRRIQLSLETSGEEGVRVLGDELELQFLFENLIDEAAGTVFMKPDFAHSLRLEAVVEAGFVRFTFTDPHRSFTDENLRRFFYPDLQRMKQGAEAGSLQGTEFLICKQIIREHDEFCGHRGCRIYAEKLGAGFCVVFTIPKG